MCIEDLFSLENSLETQHWIFTEIRHIPSKISLAIFNLYVPINFQEKRECWNSMVDFLAANTLSNIIVAGDLNITMDPKEKKRRSLWERSHAQNGGESHFILGTD